LSRPHFHLPLSVLAALFAVASFIPPASAQNGALTPLTIVTDEARTDFEVELAVTREEQAQGLMFRRELAPDKGMLFDFGSERPAAFWMMNTYVSLDMLFVRADGTIARIAERTEPLSTATVPSGVPVRFVLEVVAGTADRLGLTVGDRIEHELVAD
jgi:uncharacterized membrane protein (UPF0127 family)